MFVCLSLYHFFKTFFVLKSLKKKKKKGTITIHKSIPHLLIQILVALIQVFVLQAPFILDVDVGVEFSCQCLVQL